MSKMTKEEILVWGSVYAAMAPRAAEDIREMGRDNDGRPLTGETLLEGICEICASVADGAIAALRERAK